jgi:hypothetical protein
MGASEVGVIHKLGPAAFVGTARRVFLSVVPYRQSLIHKPHGLMNDDGVAEQPHDADDLKQLVARNDEALKRMREGVEKLKERLERVEQDKGESSNRSLPGNGTV